jgi:hypothetical protein
MEKHETAPSRQSDRKSLLEFARVLLDRTAVKLDLSGSPLGVSLDAEYLEALAHFLEAVVFHLERSAAAGHTEPCLDNPTTSPPPPMGCGSCGSDFCAECNPQEGAPLLPPGCALQFTQLVPVKP